MTLEITPWLAFVVAMKLAGCLVALWVGPFTAKTLFAFGLTHDKKLMKPTDNPKAILSVMLILGWMGSALLIVAILVNP
jgi:hypothetical protein